jgi:hypothetical protein
MEMLKRWAKWCKLLTVKVAEEIASWCGSLLTGGGVEEVARRSKTLQSCRS